MKTVNQKKSKQLNLKTKHSVLLNQTQKQKLKELIGLTIGQSSMLWTIRPIGIFKSDEAKDLSEEVFKQLLGLLEGNTK